MGVFFGSTEITGMHFGEQEITEIFFGDTEIFSVWAEYDGTLPAQYSANGSMLADYRIYGAAGGVGDGSGTANGYKVDIRTNVDSGSSPIFISEEQTYIVGAYDYRQISSSESWGEQIKAVGTFVIEYDIENNIAEAERNTPVVRLSDNTNIYEHANSGYHLNAGHYVWEIELNRPELYINKIYYWVAYPDVNLGVSNISLRRKETIIPIYIGSSPLGEDEYVDYGEGKIYRMSGGVLTPTDPPVPLPALPTVDGTNIVDYAGQSVAAPSRFVAKYRKEGF